MAECLAADLKTLYEECATGLDLEEGTFNITYQNKGKTVIVRTEGNFKMMVKRETNAEGNFEVNCVLKEEEKKELVIDEPKVDVPEYNPPSNYSIRDQDVCQHIEDVTKPYYQQMKDLGVLKEGMKTIEY